LHVTLNIYQFPTPKKTFYWIASNGKKLFKFKQDCTPKMFAKLFQLFFYWIVLVIVILQIQPLLHCRFKLWILKHYENHFGAHLLINGIRASRTENTPNGPVVPEILSARKQANTTFHISKHLGWSPFSMLIYYYYYYYFFIHHLKVTSAIQSIITSFPWWVCNIYLPC
jgi:hypothetical protein